MNAKKIIGIILIVAVVGYYLYSKNKAPQDVSETIKNTSLDQAASWTEYDIQAMTNAQIRAISEAQESAMQDTYAMNLYRYRRWVADIWAGQYTLSQKDKEEAAEQMRQIKEECTGWHAHRPGPYEIILTYDDVKFFYAVRTAWFALDDWQLKSRMENQNYSVVVYGYDHDRVKRAVAAVKERIDSMPGDDPDKPVIK